ncbi:MAG: phosphoribosylformylglycinamidine synthase subunit PurQ [Deltaproteobacteria bacterium]|nr:MAG: phosphoribosylformylglycinamidine synthase subunit PurQ [Deltaproteobacteria bacterium]
MPMAETTGRPRVLVPTGYGLNCEAETIYAVERAGGCPVAMHISDWVHRGPSVLDDVAMVVFIGGFSFGDHIASGRALAHLLRARMGDALARFVDEGGIVLGICNGFQTLVKMGLLPALGRTAGGPLATQQVTLTANERLGYRDAWVRLRVDPASPCVFTRDLGDLVFSCPARHGEGRLVFGEHATYEALSAAGQIPVRYVDADGHPTEHWPDNPNGSRGGAAGLCDATGRIFGLMPHPEAFAYPENHPHWDVGAGEEPIAARLLGAGLTHARSS